MTDPETNTFTLMWQQRTYALEAELHEAQVEVAKLREALEEANWKLANYRMSRSALQKDEGVQ